MWEDVAGTQAAGTGKTYAVCAECGEVFERTAVRSVESSLVDDARSEFRDVCPRCAALDEQGDEPIPMDAEAI